MPIFILLNCDLLKYSYSVQIYTLNTTYVKLPLFPYKDYLLKAMCYFQRNSITLSDTVNKEMKIPSNKHVIIMIIKKS